MARILPRTPAEDRADAWEAHANLERELRNLRGHLAGAPVWLADVPPGTMYAAARSARIIAALADDVARHATAAAERAAAELQEAGDTRNAPGAALDAAS